MLSGLISHSPDSLLIVLAVVFAALVVVVAATVGKKPHPSKQGGGGGVGVVVVIIIILVFILVGCQHCKGGERTALIQLHNGLYHDLPGSLELTPTSYEHWKNMKKKYIK